ncbi:hypothetical protein V494_05725 [Pseudogymnoascus sp. VKM F-4513 (FW-928)]|nr:hypothetical protein V494_05725 [Pseudogymnoascus sp. VKM F-4513 (FW-928)]
MPLPSDEQILATSRGLVDQLQALFGKHPGFRPAHAKGHLLTGTFTPTDNAAKLSTAPHFTLPSTPILARFSTSTGLPAIPDTAAPSIPHGFAVRFQLPPRDGRRVHTDIISHSTPTFPTRTGAEFLELLKAIGDSASSTESPKPVEKFLGAHPAAHYHVTHPPPVTGSYATDTFYGVNAFYLVAADGKKTAIRYRIIPKSSPTTLSAEELEGKPDNFLRTELESRISAGPLVFSLVAQVAASGDAIDDATVLWPEDREIVELGQIKLDALLDEEEGGKEQKSTIFDPIPRIEGVEASGDPLLEMRAAVYLISGRERREA